MLSYARTWPSGDRARIQALLPGSAIFSHLVEGGVDVVSSQAERGTSTIGVPRELVPKRGAPSPALGAFKCLEAYGVMVFSRAGVFPLVDCAGKDCLSSRNQILLGDPLLSVCLDCGYLGNYWGPTCV